MASQSMTSLIRWTGPVAVLGGVLWIVVAVLLAAKPEGCIGAECDMADRSSRAYSDLIPLLFAAGICTVLAVAGLVLLAWHAGRFGRLGQIGVLCLAIGTGLLLLALVVQGLVYEGDFPYMPTVVIPSGLMVVVGFLLVTIIILRARLLPRWAVGLLLLGGLALLGYNDQNEQALMAIPFGVAWVIVGSLLWLENRTQGTDIPVVRS